ncbi:MAG: type II toxin-antitoxin system Phd/YefM family antitoxin [Bacillota bacterium]
MERIMGINDARPKLTAIIESLKSGEAPVIITVNSEPRSVLIDYDEYCRLLASEKEHKRLSLKLTLEKIRSRANETGLTEKDINIELKAVRN